MVLLLDRIGNSVFCWPRNWSSHISIVFGKACLQCLAIFAVICSNFSCNFLLFIEV